MTNLAPAYMLDMVDEREDRLESQLARLGAAIPRSNSGQRWLSAPDTRGLLANLLREVDETLLPRRMVIEIHGRAVAYLNVSARRVLHLGLPGGPSSAGNGSHSPDQIASKFINQLKGVLGATTVLTLRITHLTPDPNAANMGCSARSLARAASLRIDPVKQEVAARSFFEAVGRYSIACLALDSAGVPIAADGSDTQIARLSEMSRDDLDDFDWQLEQTITRPGAPGCIILNYSADAGFCLIYGRSKAGGFMAFLPAQAVPKIQPLWRQHFG